jgi:anthranilate phosphoribosyltransferase
LVDDPGVIIVHDILKHLLTGASLSEELAEEVFLAILAGECDEAQIATILSLIAQRTPTVDELVGGARAMRRHVTPVRIPANGAALIDTCGTGGAPKLFNVSTVGALITASAAPGRVMVAKHGSLSRTGRGSAEVLQALGVNVAATPVVQAKCLEEIGVCFCFSVHHHPAMKHAAGVRKSLGFPTIFNLLGPITNPAGARRQLVGTYNPSLAMKMAQTLARLGVDRAMVVTSEDGLDEFTTTAPNITHTIEHGAISTGVLDASACGIARARVEQLQVHSLEQAARTVLDVLSGATSAAVDMALLNAGASLFVAGVVPDVQAGVEVARQAVETGRARAVLAELVRLTNAAA